MGSLCWGEIKVELLGRGIRTSPHVPESVHRAITTLKRLQIRSVIGIEVDTETAVNQKAYIGYPRVNHLRSHRL